MTQFTRRARAGRAESFGHDYEEEEEQEAEEAAAQEPEEEL